MDYIENARREIQAWENEKPGFLSKVGNFVVKPLERAAGALVPASVADTVARLIYEALRKMAAGTQATLNPAATIKGVAAAAENIGGSNPSLADRLRAADEQAYKTWTAHATAATLEGAGTGALGFAGLAVDIPALLGILLRQIQDVASCYGYDVNQECEMEYVLHILQAGAAADVRTKVEFVIALKEFEQILLRVSWKKMSESMARKEFSRQSLLAGIRQIARSLGFQLTKRKALQLVPILGALVGASMNGMLGNDVGKAAYMCYRRRWLKDHDGPATGEGVVPR